MTVRLGVIGCGTVTYYCHLPALSAVPDIHIVALADSDDGAIARCRARAPRAEIADVDGVLQRGDVDAVLVATPTATHADLAMRVLAAGKHLYLEKPMATSMHDATILRRAADQQAQHAVLGFNRRHHPIYRRALAVVQGGDIGNVHTIHAVFAEPVSVAMMPAWKRTRATGGGVLLDLASHHIDLVRFLLGAEVDTVVAQIESRETEHDDATLMLTMRNGAKVQLSCSFRSALADSIELHGERGVLRVDRHRQLVTCTTSRRTGYGTRTRTLPVADGIGARLTFGLDRLLRPSRDPSYAASWKGFLDLIAGRPSLSATVHDGQASLAAVLAAEAAASSGEAVVPLSF